MNQTLANLKAHENRRFIIEEGGKPFFWLGDTAWELFHRLNKEEAAYYLKKRVEQKYTVIQAVALAEFGGLTIENAYGRLPLKQNEAGQYDPALPDLSDADVYDYWDHVDYIIDLAASYGLYIAFLPTWGDKFNKSWGEGPEIFDGENAFVYGKWLGERYKDKSNIIWVAGGDRMLLKRRHFDVIQRMVEGLKSGDEGRHLVTFHPQGGFSSSFHVHEEPWLDFNMIQSGHGNKERDNYKKVATDYVKEPIKPTLDGEPCYEDHPKGADPDHGYFDQADVRKAAYYSLFAGSFGHTYGHHCVWPMFNGSLQHDPNVEPGFMSRVEKGDYFIMHWKEALERPGAAQMQYVRALMEYRPMFDLVPDQELLAQNYAGSNYMVAARGKDYAYIYCPNGLNVSVHMGRIAGQTVNANWYNPRTGQLSSIGNYANKGTASFIPPTQGRGEDWVLIFDDASK